MRRIACLAVGMALLAPSAAFAQQVPISTLGRFGGWRENALIGYGLVTGLAGSGDTRQNDVTRQALRNVLSRLGASVVDDQISSRNVAVVIVTARLPASANVGDRIDATVSSVGDARSLAGGTLLMTPLLGPDGQPYALAQGALVTGGYNFRNDLNREQRNYPTSANLEGGATIERAVDASIVGADGAVHFLLNSPDFGTAERVAEAINARFGTPLAEARNADEVSIRYSAGRAQVTAFAAAIQAVTVEPARLARVVINERTGTVVAGGDVLISSVVISQGDIRVTVGGQRDASQPSYVDGYSPGARSLVVTNSRMDVEEGANDAVVNFPNTSVADLVEGLSRAHVDTRRTIAILQAIKAAGALHADLVVE
jgi:flagellar P-ring protein FlgI